MADTLSTGPLRRLGRASATAAAWAALGGSLVAAWLVISADSTALDDGTDELPSLIVSPVNEARSESVSARLMLEVDSVNIASPGGGTVSRAIDLPPRIDESEDIVWVELDGAPKVIAVFDTDRAFYRPLARSDRGDDVAALQMFLADRGHYDGDIDGRFGYGVERALVAWREATSAGTSKTLAPGDLVFVPAGRLVPVTPLDAGASLVPDQAAATVKLDDLTFRIRLPFTEAIELEVGYSVTGPEFEGTIGSIADDAVVVDGELYLDLFIEGDLTVNRQPGETLPVRISSPAAPQLWIPASAVAVDSNGEPFVVSAQGDTIPVTVGDTLEGSVPISGLDEAAEVVVPNPSLIGNGP